MRYLKDINNAVELNGEDLTMDNVFTVSIQYGLQLLEDTKAQQYRESIHELEDEDRAKFYLKGVTSKRILTTMGEIEVIITRFQEKGYVSVIAEPWQRDTESLDLLITTSFLYGLSTRDIERLLKQLGINVSRSKVSRINKKLEKRVLDFKNRDLSKLNIAILSLDATFVTIRDEDPENKHYIKKPAIRVLGLNAETGYWELLALKIYDGETQQAYQEVLQDIKRRGLKGNPALFLRDFADSIAGAIEAEFPAAFEQCCLFHGVHTVYKSLPKRGAHKVKKLIHKITHEANREIWEKDLEEFEQKWGEEYPEALKKLQAHLEETKVSLILNDEFKTNNVNERANEEDKRLIKSKGAFKNTESAERIMILNSLDYLSNHERKKQADLDKVVEMKEIYDRMVTQIKETFDENFFSAGIQSLCPKWDSPVIWIDTLDLDYDLKDFGIKTKAKVLVCYKLEKRKLKRTLLWSCPVYDLTPSKYLELLNIIKNAASRQPEVIVLPADNTLLFEATKSIFNESEIQIDLDNFNDTILGLLPKRWRKKFTELFKQAFENDSIEGMTAHLLDKLVDKLKYHHFYNALNFFEKFKSYMLTFFKFGVNYFFNFRNARLLKGSIQLDKEESESNSEYLQKFLNNLKASTWSIPIVYKDEFKALFARFELREKQKKNAF